MNLVEQNSDGINAFCEKHKVEKLFGFGSVMTNAFNKKSDIEFSVDFKDREINKFVSNFFGLKENLEALLDRKIDLIESEAISTPYFKEEIEKTKTLLYESTFLF